MHSRAVINNVHPPAMAIISWGGVNDVEVKPFKRHGRPNSRAARYLAVGVGDLAWFA